MRWLVTLPRERERAVESLPNSTPPIQPTRPARRYTRSTCVLGGLVLTLVVSTRWVRVNVSPSVPFGLYHLTALDSPLRPGTLVVLPVPDVMRPWWREWWVPLLKPVAAVGGDVVCVEQGWLRVGGDWLGPVLAEAHGKLLPHWEGCHVVPEDHVFLASDAPHSLDSRYFNSVPISQLTAAAVPLLTWR